MTPYHYHLIVDKYHVGRSDRSLLRHIILTRPIATGGVVAYKDGVRIGRVKGVKAWTYAIPRDKRHAFLRGCLDAHHENQAEYASVMRGRGAVPFFKSRRSK